MTSEPPGRRLRAENAEPLGLRPTRCLSGFEMIGLIPGSSTHPSVLKLQPPVLKPPSPLCLIGVWIINCDTDACFEENTGFWLLLLSVLDSV